MFTVYEYAGGLLVIVTGATLLFMACVMVLVLIEGVSILAHRLCKPTYSATQPGGRWMTVESRESQVTVGFLTDGRAGCGIIQHGSTHPRDSLSACTGFPDEVKFAPPARVTGAARAQLEIVLPAVCRVRGWPH